MGDKKPYDVGVVIHTSRNYGNNLTNYSLINTISSMDKSLLIIPNKNLISLFESNVFDKYDVERRNLENLNSLCQMFILGSDQTFAKWCIKKDYFTCMPWVDSKIYKATFSSSFGSNEVEIGNEHYHIFRYLLSRFDNISLREKSSIDMLWKKFGLHAEFVIDPVFLTEGTEYRKLKNISRLPDEPYVGAYLLDPDSQKETAIYNLMNLMDIRKNCIITDAMKSPPDSSTLNILRGASVEEFIAMIDECDVLVTDSFHGACFAIILNKPFYVTNITKSRGIDRIYALFELFDIPPERWLLNINEISISALDYSGINKKITQERKRAKRYLTNIISEGSSKNSYNPDYAYEYIKSIKKELYYEKKLNDKLYSIVSSIIGVDAKALLLEKTAKNYLRNIPKDCMMLVSTLGNVNAGWSDVEEFFLLKMDENSSLSYLSYDGHTLHNIGQNKCVLDTVLKGHKIQILSENNPLGDPLEKSIFIVDEKEYYSTEWGLNILVYSLKTNSVVDLVNIPVHKLKYSSIKHIDF